MARKRKLETDEQRSDRLKAAAKQLHEADAREGDALDKLVRNSIRLHGP